MTEYTYLEAKALKLMCLTTFNGEPYQLISMKVSRDKVTLGWRHPAAIFLDRTMVKLPGRLSYHKLADFVEEGDIPKDIFQEIYRHCGHCGVY